jgi:mRNA interferase RelE/StbE
MLSNRLAQQYGVYHCARKQFFGNQMSDTQPYRVEFTDIALTNLARYPQKDQRLILARIEQLAANPQQMVNVKRLVAFDVAYRLRVGNYRVLFDRDDVIRLSM